MAPDVSFVPQIAEADLIPNRGEKRRMRIAGRFLTGFNASNCILVAAGVLFASFAALSQNTQQGSAVTVTIRGDSVLNAVSPLFFGHNYWQWCPSWGDLVSGTESKVKMLNVRFLRFGGMQADLEYPDRVGKGTLSRFMAYCKKINAKPLLQVQIARFKNQKEKIDNAIEMVGQVKSMASLTYVSIGNEPDIYSSNLATNEEYHAAYLSGYKLSDYCADFNAVAGALKNAYPDLKIIGLELSWNYDGWIPEFVASCKEAVDMVSVHYYPFTAGQCTFETVRGQYEEFRDFYLRIRKLIDKNAGGKELPLIIGETNITWDGDPKKNGHDASPGTFAAGLWFADYAGVSSSVRNLVSIMPWGIREGWMLGFLTGQERPVYHAYKMFSDHIKADCIYAGKINSFVNAYAYKDSVNDVSLFAVNWDTADCITARFAFSGVLRDSAYTCTLPPFSLTCMTFSADFKEKKMFIYTKRLQDKGPITESDSRFKSQFEKKRGGFFKIRPLR